MLADVLETDELETDELETDESGAEVVEAAMIVWVAAMFVVGGLATAVWSLQPDRSLRPDTGQGTPTADTKATTTSYREVSLQRSVTERILAPAGGGLLGLVRRFTPAGWLDKTSQTLKVADLDKKYSAEAVLVVRIAVGLLGLALGGLFLATTGDVKVSGLLVVVAVMGPQARLKRFGDERRKAIQNELPDVLDQLTVTVEAGMSFDNALLRAGQEGRGLIAKELLRVVADVQLGLSRSEALQALADRTDVADLRSFVNAVRQAESHGFPLGRILRLQSQEMREKRRTRAEEKAMQVPVKITFPLVFCILPALFIIILGPAALSISEGL